MRILCYGDSNTYGYDPRSFLSDRYPTASCWTSQLADAGYEVVNAGMNGREIPHRPAEINAAIQAISAVKADLLIIMLGSNDLLMNPHYTAENISQRMAVFLQELQLALPAQKILLIAPVPMVPGTWVQEDRLLRESTRLADVYEALSKELNIAFTDASQWNVDLVFDGVHFTERGHQAFSAGLLAHLQPL